MSPDDLINLDGLLTKVTQDGPPDECNNPTATTETVAAKCWYELERATEDTVNTDLQSETHRLYFRAGTDVTGFDSLAVNGHTFHILGPPWEAINPRTGEASHIETKGRQST